ncbi:MAG TPA: hypothetical protein VFN16_12250 [Saccharospirillum sp.]|nr:hypothetical protein [Saccharospirillum sp.]
MLTRQTLAIPTLIALGSLLVACGESSGGGTSEGSGGSGAGTGSGSGSGSAGIDLWQAGFDTQAQDRWSWMHPLPQNYNLQSVISDGQQFHAVGSRGTYMTSPTGSNWTIRHFPIGTLQDITWDGSNTFVAVGNSSLLGDEGLIAYSTNGGTDWQPAEVPGSPGQFNEVVWTGNAFVAMGVGAGEVATSPNGINWTLSNNGQTASTNALANQGSTLVNGQSAGAFYSQDGGSTWTPVTGAISSTSPVRALEYDDGQFIGVGDYKLGGFVTSANGIDWSRDEADRDYNLQGSVSNSFTFTDVTRFGDKYWVSDFDGNLHVRDQNAPNWTQPATSSFGFITSLANRDGYLLAVGKNGGLLQVREGYDPEELQSAPLGESDFTAMVQDDSGNILIGTGDGKVWLTSDDGYTWTDNTVLAGHAIADLAFSGYEFVAVGTGFMATSPDGENWTVQDGFKQTDYPDADMVYDAVAATIDGWVALSNNFLTVCTLVTDCETLDKNTPAFGMNRIVHDGHNYVAVNTSGGIFRSVNGNEWSRVFTAEGSLSTVVASTEALVVSPFNKNSKNKVYVSKDLGVTWEPPQFSGGADVGGGVLAVSDNTLFLYDADNYTLWTSTDGLSWEPEYAPHRLFDAVEISNGQLMRGDGNRLFKRLVEEE